MDLFQGGIVSLECQHIFMCSIIQIDSNLRSLISEVQGLKCNWAEPTVQKLLVEVFR